MVKTNGYTYCPFKSLAIFEMDIGGLLTLEEMSLLNTVLLNIESGILLERNLKSYTNQNTINRTFMENLPWWEGERKGWCF